MKKTTMVLLMLLSLAAPLALASDGDRERDEHRRRGEERHHYLSAPEIDPIQAMGALTLLSGTVAIIRAYRRKK
jgi:hypothetical protein